LNHAPNAISPKTVQTNEGIEAVSNTIDEVYKKCVGDKFSICLYQPCVESCQFLKDNCATPGELAKRVKKGEFKENPVVPYSCNLCNLCEQVCVRGLDIGKMCLEIREEMVREGSGPMPRHKAVIDEQEWLASDDYALTLPPPDGSECKRLFFPGCGLASYSPDLVVNTYEYLQDKLPGTGMLLRCCSAPLHQMGEVNRFEESLDNLKAEMDKFGVSEMIVCCPDCKHLFKEEAPDIQVTSIYEVMAEHGLPEDIPAPVDNPFSLHDSCKARYDAHMQASVRKIVSETGNRIEEIEFSGERTRCCGMGGLIAYADFKFNMQVIKARVKEMPNDALSYCAACRNTYAMVGKPSAHVLDLVFNPNWEKTKKHPGKQGPAKQKIMTRLRERLVSEYPGS
jgi:Fe-S oxidoreductase